MLSLDRFSQALAEPLGDLGESAALSRRALLGLGAGAAAVTSGVAAQTPTFGRVNANHRLLRRISYGLTSADIAKARRTSYPRLLEYHLKYQSIPNTQCDAEIATRYPRLAMDQQTLIRIADDWRTTQQFGEATIYRAVNSNHQLLERMVEFWSDHFNIHIDKVGGWAMVDLHNTVIRPHALGKFRDLLFGVAKSPAMMLYLDNIENYGDFGNVNFARELMELHTISVAGGYTPNDIRNVQRAFSGWSIEWDSMLPTYGQFVFNEWGHSTLPKTVMGQAIPPGGISEGEWVLNFLANHPSTATFICKKLAKFFLQENPPNSVINAAASKFIQTQGDIKAVLRVILSARNIGASPWKFKRPYYLMMNAMRCMKAQTDIDMWTLRYDHLYRAGNLPYDWSPPDGYPDRLDFWVKLLLPRWNFAFTLPRGYVWGVQVDVAALTAGNVSSRAIAGQINSLLFAGEIAHSDYNRLQQFLNATSINNDRLQGAFALAIASPSFQWF